ncbi:MAG: carbohydrate ABC transporter permease [Albidovulum sp.]|nr:carbohydrate ABC transporter permease [Albidovulum sp.]MDE0534090.1 carbohydrate ABC transporter permease [Albidovulum sp.]
MPNGSAKNSASVKSADAAAYGVLAVISLYCAIPFLWVFIASVDSEPSQFLAWPKEWSLQNYINIFARQDGFLWIANSLIIVGSATLIVMVLGGLGGYALSRSHGWWRRPFLYTIILIRVVPPTALIVPLYKVLLTANSVVGGIVRAVMPPDLVRPTMHIFGFIDGYLGIILVLAATQLPLALWIMKTFFDTIPRDYEEAAVMDGATLMQTIRRVLIPLALPGLGAAGLFAFIIAWGDFLMPLIFLSSAELQTLPLGLFRAYMRVNQLDYGFMTALAVIYTLPAVIAFGFARRFLVQTFGGGVKG